MRRAVIALYGISFALHVGIATGVASIPKERHHEATAITMAEQKKPKKTEPPKPVDPPKPPPESKADRTSQPKAKAAAEAKSDSAPKPASNNATPSGASMDGLPDFGLSLGGGGGGGLAIPAGGGGPAGGDPAPASSARKIQAPPPKSDDDCADAPTKPKLKSKVQPAYPERAREAKVEGSVRIQVQVDATGKVLSASVVSGLGHGLDEAALSAARQWTFEPASKCGKPVAGTAVGPVSFRLPP